MLNVRHEDLLTIINSNWLSLISVALLIISISYDNIALIKVAAEIWKHSNIIKKKFERTRKMIIEFVQDSSLDWTGEEAVL